MWSCYTRANFKRNMEGTEKAMHNFTVRSQLALLYWHQEVFLHHHAQLQPPRRTQRAVQHLLTPIHLQGTHHYCVGYKGNRACSSFSLTRAEDMGEVITPPLKIGGWQVFSRRSFSQQLLFKEILWGVFLLALGF